VVHRRLKRYPGGRAFEFAADHRAVLDGVAGGGAAETMVGLTDVFRPYPERRGLYRPNVGRAAPAAVPKVAAMAEF
jgi:hypothetical protein